jgi:Xaa-Pro dipeptidase
VSQWFDDAEYDSRLAAVRREMAARDVDLILLSAPENIFYLTGLDDWGYFAPVMLVLPAEGEMVVATRVNKQETIASQVTTARFEGHTDSETLADAVARALASDRSVPGRIGLEMWSWGLPHGLARALEAAFAAVDWIDVTGLVDSVRHVKSAAEQDYMRAAARITDSATSVALAAVGEGVSEAEIAAAYQEAMIEAGSDFPGFGPFVRSSTRLGHEHSTWSDRRLQAGDPVLFELSGCVARYHAPVGRLVYVGRAPDQAHAMADLARNAFEAASAAMRHGALAREVYAAWQAAVDNAGLSHYRRHHCGYMVGIGVPPSWIGGVKPVGLRHDSDLVLQTGMTFHVHSWLVGTGRADFFLSNTVLVGDAGPEVLTRTPIDITAG